MTARYENYLLTYLDIMGFKDMVEESASDPVKVGQIVWILQHMKRQAEMGNYLLPERKQKIQNFSDLIVRAMPLTPAENLTQQVTLECWMLASIQSELILEQGILLRGSVSVNQLYMHENLVFGPALVRAYHLESEIAMYPRIVIDPVIMQIMNDDIAPLDWYLIRGDDGAYFIDYLAVAYSSPTILLGYDPQSKILDAHKSAVEQRLQQLSGRGERAKQKAIWLALYHNAAVKRIAQYNRTLKDDLKQWLIPESHLKL